VRVFKQLPGPSTMNEFAAYWHQDS